MNSKLAIMVIITAVFCLPGFASAQEMQSRASQGDTEKKRQRNDPNGYLSLMDKFVGAQTGRWAVSLVSEGGVFGTVTLFSLNADNKLLCGSKDDEPATHEAPAGLFDLALPVAAGELATKPLETGKLPKDRIRYCNDCSYESFVVYVRVGEVLTETRYQYKDGDPVMKRLYEAIPANGGCPTR